MQQRDTIGLGIGNTNAESTIDLQEEIRQATIQLESLDQIIKSLGQKENQAKRLVSVLKESVKD